MNGPAHNKKVEPPIYFSECCSDKRKLRVFVGPCQQASARYGVEVLSLQQRRHQHGLARDAKAGLEKQGDLEQRSNRAFGQGLDCEDPAGMEQPLQPLRFHVYSYRGIRRKTGCFGRRNRDERLEKCRLEGLVAPQEKLESRYADRTNDVRTSYGCCTPIVQGPSDQYAYRTGQPQFSPFGVRIPYPFNYYHVLVLFSRCE